MTHVCPMCSVDFDGAGCHGSCPMSAGCAMIRCPRCGFEFVEEGRISAMLRRWLATPRKPKSSERNLP